MIEIGVSKIVKNYGYGNVLNDVTFDVTSGEIVSLVGDNGSGKSTLLKIIAKEENATSGNVAIRKGATIGYLDQTSFNYEEDIIVKDMIYKSVKNITDIEDRLKQYEEKMLDASAEKLNNIIDKYTNLQEKFISMGGYEVSEKIGRIVTGFKIQKLLDLNYNKLSGGEKRIVSFAMLMVKNPDILLLDEPTNHLDIETLEWLENYLKKYRGTILIVSHDRYFLDRICNKTILLENGESIIFNSNYSGYLDLNEKRIMLEFKDYKDQQKQIKVIKESIKKLREYGRLGDNEKFFKRAKSIEKRLEKLNKVNRPKEKNIIPLNFNYQNRTGDNVLIVENLNIKYDNKIVFEHASMEINYRDRVGLIGINGSGKSTLVKNIINGHDSIRLGSNVKIGYIPQEIIFDEDITVYDFARKYFIGDENHLRSSLFKFMFVNDMIFKKVNKLSGGEKVRLKLFCLMQEEINFLILDEPTNHIDITTREVLEDTLCGYKGTILFVSHDRYFINKVATKIVSIENYELVEYTGNYDDYKEQYMNSRR